MQRIAVVDFGTGNLHSVCKALEHVAPNDQVIVTRDQEKISESDRVVLPGQGAMGSWLHAMDAYGLRDCVSRALAEVPVLGICLGMQALLEKSDEDGGIEGLGFVPGRVRRFVKPAGADAGEYKIPHMGWNQIRQTRDHPLWHGIESGTRFYFVHSYYADPAFASDTVAETEYIVAFTSAMARKQVFAVQFHPEKSHAQGLTLLENFVAWKGD